MRIGLQTWGTTGDVLPFLALAGGLRARGHEVHLVATAIDACDHAALAHRLDVALTMLPTGLQEQPLLPELLTTPGHRQLPLLIDRFLLPGITPMTEAAESLAQRSDVLVGHCLVHPLRIAAAQRGLPWSSVAFWPGMVPTQLQAPYPLPQLGRLGNRLSWWLMLQLVNHVVLPRLSGAFTAAGLPAPRDACRDIWFSQTASLIAASPLLCAWPQQLGAHHLTGTWHLQTHQEAPLAPLLEAFLTAGAPPVLMTLGSLQAADADGAIATFRAAAAIAGCRAIIQDPRRQGDGASEGPVFLAGRLPHAQVLPRCALAVHHGGAGTSQAVLRAGIPAVVTPILEEQLAWGRLLAARGVALKPVRWRRLTPRQLARGISLALADLGMAQRARILGAQLVQEQGIAAAVAVIEAHGRVDAAPGASAIRRGA